MMNRPIDRTPAENARWWRNREADERAFLQSNCLTPEARRNSERWVERFAEIAAEYEQEVKV